MGWRLKENQNGSGEITHYGILGMKWGVRRYQPYPKGKHGTFLGQDRDEDIHIRKGTKAYRLQEGEALGPGQKYVSFDTFDHYAYVAQTSAGELGLNIDLRSGNGRSVRMVLQRDIIAPSYEATMNNFIKTISDMNGPKSFAKETFTEDVSKGFGKFNQKKFLENIMNMKSNEALDKAYMQFTRTFMSDTKAKQIFFNNLKEAGYNAIIDENDKQFGKGGLTDTPMIVFDSSNLKVTGVRRIKDDDIDYFSDLIWGGGYSPKTAGVERSKEYWEKFANNPKKLYDRYGIGDENKINHNDHFQRY